MQRQAGTNNDDLEVTADMAYAGAEIMDQWAKDIQGGWVSALEIAPLVWSAMMRERHSSHQKAS